MTLRQAVFVETTMLLFLSALFLLLAVHPFTSYPLSLALLRWCKGKPQKRLGARAETPSFAICVPAYNEEHGIIAKAENLLALQRSVPSCEVLVYIDAATDRTEALLEPYRDRIDVVVAETRRGKSHGLNLLTARATADILVFTDANVMLHPEALVRIGEAFERPEVGCVSGHLRYQNGSESSTAAAGDLYWKIEEAIRQLESDTVGIVGVDGSLFATRRALHPFVPADIIDDFYVSMKILLEGHAVVRAPEALAFERTGSDERDEFGRKVRIACQAFNVHRRLWPQICRARLGLVYAYLSHRLLKWLIVYNLALSAAFAVAELAELTSLRVAASATVMIAAAGYVAWRLDVPPARRLGSMLVAFVGAGLGVLRSLRGDRFQTWNPIATARMRAEPPR